MALANPSESPAVVVREIDLTGGVPNVQSSTGAFVINSRWGTVLDPQLVANEEDLVAKFGSPDSGNAVSFHEANMFLKYSSKLQVVRATDASHKNAHSTTAQVGLGSVPSAFFSGVKVNNLTAFNSQLSALDSDKHTFIAKYPGTLGNSLQVQVCPFSPADSAFNDWTYKNEFDQAPGTSGAALKVGAINDEAHVVVVDKDGSFTGTRGTVLERYAFLSLGKNAIDSSGANISLEERINSNSSYIWVAGLDSSYTAVGSGATMSNGTDLKRTVGTQDSARAVSVFEFDSGTNPGSIGVSAIANGFDLFEDKDTVEVDFLIAPSMSSRSDTTTVVNDLVTTAASLRKDCIVVASPARSDVVNQTNATTITDNIVATSGTLTKSSYLVMDGNYLKIFDKFNDQFIFVGAASSTAGIMAATDINRAPWFSPAGSRRGQYFGITSIPYSPTKAQRDTLYKNGVNPIANIPGAGVILFGDKTKLARPSAFDRINVRRLFLVLERAISRAAEQVLFEFNDEFTRAEFVNIVEPVLREVKGRRGITDFRVVADETNNTPAVIDRNEFVASIFIKPARSINFVTLNFVAVRTGVDFEEVVGTV